MSDLQRKKNLWSWLLYDAGNSFVYLVLGGLYLAQWIIIDNNLPDIWYGGMFALSTVLVLLISPFLGAWSDNIKRRLPFLKITTLLMIFIGLIMGITILIPFNHSKIFLILGLSMLVLSLYQISQLFYNSLLENISSKETRGKYSGLGELFNNLGFVMASFILILFATNKLYLFGIQGRAQTFLPAFIIFAIVAIPMLTLFKENTINNEIKKVKYSEIYNKTIIGIKKLFSDQKNIGIFLIGFCFISDALLTAQMYFAIILNKIYQLSDVQITILLASMLFCGMISSYFIGKLGDKIKHKNMLIIVTSLLVILFSIVYLSSWKGIIYIMPLIAGIGWGGFYTSSRALLIKIAPKENLGEYFGLYSTFEKFASIIGPMVWGIITLILIDNGIIKYRVAGMVVVGLMAIGIYFIYKVKE